MVLPARRALPGDRGQERSELISCACESSVQAEAGRRFTRPVYPSEARRSWVLRGSWGSPEGSEDPWLCGTGFRRLCLCRGAFKLHPETSPVKCTVGYESGGRGAPQAAILSLGVVGFPLEALRHPGSSTPRHRPTRRGLKVRAATRCGTIAPIFWWTLQLSVSDFPTPFRQ